MIDGKLLVEKLLVYAKSHLHLNQRDEIYFRNLLMREFKIDEPIAETPDLSFVEGLDVPDTLVEEIESYAIENELVSAGEENLYSTYVFGLLSPLPSKVNEEFKKIKENEGVEKACEYFYNLSVCSNYVQKTAISKNLMWTYLDGDKHLEITINLSKPEKDNKEIAKLLSKPKKVNYPACLLCKENEGYEGTLTHPARENIRTISLSLGGEKWFVQYSPYAYFEEHIIAINEEHSPMRVDQSTIEKLLDFVDYFPNYMVGSNASLPIVGGSILNHEHYQGGKHLMPMHNAPLKHVYTVEKYPSVKVGVVDWYNNVIRIESEDRVQIKGLATQIINSWKEFSFEDCSIKANTNGVMHNSLAPVCRKTDNGYIIDLILRNNRTSDEYPDGIFHAHPEYHNVKKEGIGLIEAMGLFILPGRLKKQLGMIANILCGQERYDYADLSCSSNYLYVHREMIKQLFSEGLSKSFEQAEQRVTQRVNEICKNILINTAVFKNDANGERGLKAFLSTIGVNA